MPKCILCPKKGDILEANLDSAKKCTSCGSYCHPGCYDRLAVYPDGSFDKCCPTETTVNTMFMKKFEERIVKVMQDQFIAQDKNLNLTVATQLNSLKNDIEGFKKDVSKIKEDNKVMKDNINKIIISLDDVKARVGVLETSDFCMKSNNSSLFAEKVICEEREREKRMKNIIIHRFPIHENISDDKKIILDRIESCIVEGKQLLFDNNKPSKNDLDGMKIYRLGKNYENRRSIKIVFKVAQS